MKKRVLFSVLTILIGILSTFSVSASYSTEIPDLNLRPEQIEKLTSIIEQFGQKQTEIVLNLRRKYVLLEQELVKMDQLSSEADIKKSVSAIDTIIKQIIKSYQKLLKVRTEYFIKTKEILNDRQKESLFRTLIDFNIDIPDQISFYLRLDDPLYGLDLTSKQIKTSIQYRADLEMTYVKNQMIMDMKMVDLHDNLMSNQQDINEVDLILNEIVQGGFKNFTASMDYILKLKNLLTLEQKKRLYHRMLIMSE